MNATCKLTKEKENSEKNFLLKQLNKSLLLANAGKRKVSKELLRTVCSYYMVIRLPHMCFVIFAKLRVGLCCFVYFQKNQQKNKQKMVPGMHYT